jgi:hypothetical protein
MMLRSRKYQAAGLESLENRTLLSAINPASFGALPNDGNDDRTGIQNAINSAQAGDQIVFANGQYDFSGQIKLKSGITLAAANKLQSTLKFTVPTLPGTTNNNDFAIISWGANNVAITGLNIRSNNGVILIDGPSTNYKITNNDFQWGYAGNGYNRLAVYSSGYTNDGLIIDYNNFHDSQDSDRVAELWSLKNSSFSHNHFYNVHDVAHIMEPISNVQISYNLGEKIHRFGLEAQGNGPTTGFWVQGNVFKNWDRPYNDTDGMCVMLFGSHDTHVVNNYISADFTGGWGVSDPGVGGPRFGLGIEYAAASGSEIRGNVMGGPNPWAAYVASSTADALVKDNKFYGHAIWYDTMGQPGYTGNGSIIEQNNLHDPNRANMPAPPSIDAGAGGSGSGGGGGGGGSTGNNGDVSNGNESIDNNGTAGYLSDLNYSVVSNGWGGVEKDKSNGETAGGDGKTLTINGKTYSKGLGVHANSTITVNLNKQYKTFFSDVGIDDEVGNSGSVGFQVFGDGVLLWDSGKMTGSMAAKSLQLNVTNVQQLKLVVNTAGDGNYDDHADWAGARFA